LQLKANGKYIILGDMFELGDYAEKEHQNIVDFLSDKPVNRIVLLGENFYKTKLPSDKFKKFKEVAAFLKEENLSALSDTHILIKGSRGMKLEQILKHF